jgi:hypothetical protein
MTTPNDELMIGPRPRPSKEELAAQPTVKNPWRRPASPRSKAPLLVAALINTGWATLICLAAVIALVLLGRVSLGQRPTGVEALVGVAGWLLAHGVPVKTGPIEMTLAPLSITLLAAWRLNRAGVHTTRGIGARNSGSLLDALRVAGVIGGVYGALGLVAALIADRPGLSVSWWRAGLQLAVIGAFAALLGSIRTTGALNVIARRTPTIFRDALRAGVVAALLLLGAGAGLIGLSVAIHGEEAARAFNATPNGIAGQAGVTVVCLAFAPNLSSWAAAYLLGPGFVLRAGTIASPAMLTTGQMPDDRRALLDQLPVFAALPDAPLRGVFGGLLALPVLAGIGAGILLVRRRLRPRRTRSGDTVIPKPHWSRMLTSAALAGPVGGLVMNAVGFASSGHLDDGEPALGPMLWQSALFATLALGLGAVLAVAGALAWRKSKGGSTPG